MLDAAGVTFRAVAPEVDENALKVRLDDPAEIAARVAAAKAMGAHECDSRDWVIGSDSVVTVAGRLFNKPANLEEAAAHLRFFSGKALRLTSAVAVARDGKIDWSHVDTATLHVRSLSERFIEAYLNSEWPDVSYCVGVFRMEGRGVQLFDRIEGDHFTILGMPLIPLLNALRERDLLPS